MTGVNHAMPEGREALAEAIAQALESGAPFERGAALSDFGRLFADGRPAPELALAFEPKTGALTALPLEEAFGSGCFIPFDFDASPGADPRAASRLGRGRAGRPPRGAG